MTFVDVETSSWARARRILRIFRYSAMLAYALFLFVLIGFAGRATVEIANRARLLSSLSLQLAAGNEELVSEQDSKAIDNLKSERKAIKEKLRRAQNLSSVGALEYCGTVQGILECKESTTGALNATSTNYVTATIGSWSDETIFLVLAICCGAIGALIGGLRTDDFTLFRDLALGFASGFIVYLAIKGGKHFFLLSANPNEPVINPYAFAFAGILVGLFTEKAYNLLAYFMDEIERRLRHAAPSEPDRGVDAEVLTKNIENRRELSVIAVKAENKID